MLKLFNRSINTNRKLNQVRYRKSNAKVNETLYQQLPAKILM